MCVGHRKWAAAASVLALLGVSLPAVALDHPTATLNTTTVEEQTAPSLPVPFDFFTENAGQVGNPEVLYYARGGGVSVGFAPGAVLVNLRERQPHVVLDSPPAPLVPVAP